MRLLKQFLVIMSMAPLTFVPKTISAYEFNDSHFHLMNYIQHGPSTQAFLKIMGDKAGRVALFGIPLQQKWDYALTGDSAPDYYLSSKARLYYYSAVDAVIAMEYQSLTLDEQKRFDPMITGFNPTDMYATDHILRMLHYFPGVFSGIGEFSVHKEFVSGKIAGHAASLTDKALDRIFDLAGRIGLLVILHNDIDEIRPARGSPAYLKQMKTFLRKHRRTKVIWAHTGLGRFVKPTTAHLEILEGILSNPDFAHVHFDISWDEVAKYITKTDETVQQWTALIARHSSRFLFGTDSVAPKTRREYTKTWRDYRKLWDRLDADIKRKVAFENYARLFDEANRKVRNWEMDNFRSIGDAIPERHYFYGSRRDEIERRARANAAK